VACWLIPPCLQCFDMVRWQDGHLACKNWMLVCWWQWFDWSFERLHHPTSIYDGLSFWYRPTLVELEYWPLKQACVCTVVATATITICGCYLTSLFYGDNFWLGLVPHRSSKEGSLWIAGTGCFYRRYTFCRATTSVKFIIIIISGFGI